MGGGVGGGCRCTSFWCDPYLNIDLVSVTLTFIMFSRLYLRNLKV